MRRRTKAIGVTISLLTGAAMIVGDVPSYVLLEGPSLAAESESITNSGVAVDGNVPPGLVERVGQPSPSDIRNGVSEIGGNGVSSSRRSANANADAPGDDAAGDAAAAAAREAAARRDASQREAAARRQAAIAEDEARDEGADARAGARSDADDAEDEARDDAEDARDDADDVDRDDFEPDRP